MGTVMNLVLILAIYLQLDIFLYDVDAFQTSLNGFMQVI